jgi:two-component system chemotaxis response regulator CheB
VNSVTNANHRVIVVGTSTGGLTTLKSLVSGLSADINATILIVQHIGRHKSLLPEILQRLTTLPVRFATDMEALGPGIILIAPPDRHLIVHQTHVRTMHTAKENFARPAVDPLFKSAAARHGNMVIGVVLSGDLDDGTVGLQAVKTCGGITIVQDPEEAIAPSMPRSAMEYIDVDYCLPANQIANLLVTLAGEESHVTATDIPEALLVENLFSDDRGSMDDLERVGTPSRFTCPECHGGLWKIHDSGPERYRCHTGHSYTSRYLMLAQSEGLEEALWSAVRALQEKQKLYEQFSATAGTAGKKVDAEEYARQAQHMVEQARILKNLLNENVVAAT